MAYKIVLVGSLRRALIPDLTRTDEIKADGVLFVKISIMLAVGLLSTCILCPLEVIATKLAIQRNHAAPEYNSVAQEVEDDAVTGEEYAEYSGAEEDVIGYVCVNSSRVYTDRWLLAVCATNVIHTLDWRTAQRKSCKRKDEVLCTVHGGSPPLLAWATLWLECRVLASTVHEPWKGT